MMCGLHVCVSLLFCFVLFASVCLCVCVCVCLLFFLFCLFVCFFFCFVLLLLLLYAEFVTVRNWCFQLGHFLVGD